MSHSSSRAYPRGLPFKPPDEVAARDAQLRRWVLAIAIGISVVFLLMVGTGIYFVKKLNQIAESAVANRAVQPAVRIDPAAEPESRKRTSSPPVATVPKKPSLESTQRERILDALGKLAGVHLYQASLNIGLLADCTEGEIYSPEDAQKWLERITAQMELIDRQLEALREGDLEPDEQQALERCRQVSALLRAQSKELKEYWKTGTKEQAAKYHKSREAAWAGVSELLQLPKE